MEVSVLGSGLRSRPLIPRPIASFSSSLNKPNDYNNSQLTAATTTTTTACANPLSAAESSLRSRRSDSYWARKSAISQLRRSSDVLSALSRFMIESLLFHMSFFALFCCFLATQWIMEWIAVMGFFVFGQLWIFHRYRVAFKWNRNWVFVIGTDLLWLTVEVRWKKKKLSFITIHVWASALLWDAVVVFFFWPV